ncbi:GntT/GntP/DsdX family permease [Lactobacillus helsingborgensis]|uniref:GntT/GntP/DsdX family permease n=1 Tax=Lactobacillus helsingborgensis TaxID=1218494 RepID=UPI001CC49294|nr:SLC13 family permease [Lactobacillus helsingborgensis]
MSTGYLATVGFIMIILIMVLLLTQKVTAMFAFAVIPIIGGLIVGMSPTDIGSSVQYGLGLTTSVALVMLFALPYFLLLADTGFFNEIVRKVLRHVRITPPLLICLTLIISWIVGLDASVTSQYIIVMPLLYPFYKKFKISPIILMFFTTMGIVMDFDLPWTARTLRAVSLVPKVQNGPTALFGKILPVQVVFFILLLVIAYMVGLYVQKKQHIIVAKTTKKERIALANEVKDDQELTRPKLFWINVILTLIIIVCMVAFPTFPQYYLFAIGIVIAFMINYPDQKLQNKLWKKYAKSMVPVMPTILLSGVVVGIMTKSGMMKSMVNVLLRILPKSVGPYVYIIIALISPLMFLFTNDTWYFVLMPIVMSLETAYGVSEMVVIATLFMNMGALLSPIAQPQIYLGPSSVADSFTVPDYIKKSFLPIWLLNIVWVLLGLLLGAFR